MPSFELLLSCKHRAERGWGQGARGSTHPNSYGPPVPCINTPPHSKPVREELECLENQS